MLTKTLRQTTTQTTAANAKATHANVQPPGLTSEMLSYPANMSVAELEAKAKRNQPVTVNGLPWVYDNATNRWSADRASFYDCLAGTATATVPAKGHKCIPTAPRPCPIIQPANATPECDPLSFAMVLRAFSPQTWHRLPPQPTMGKGTVGGVGKDMNAPALPAPERGLPVKAPSHGLPANATGKTATVAKAKDPAKGRRAEGNGDIPLRRKSYEVYCRGVAAGLTQADAWAWAGGDCEDKEKLAAKLAHLSGIRRVANRIKHLRSHGQNV